MSHARASPPPPRIVDAGDGLVTPGFVDSHTHLVWAGDRSGEFALRCAGADYLSIARAGGGIASTVRAVREASDETLISLALPRLQRLLAQGVTTAEVKSGYGLDAETELRMLRVIDLLGSRQPIRLLRTFLWPHAMPPGTHRPRGLPRPRTEGPPRGRARRPGPLRRCLRRGGRLRPGRAPAVPRRGARARARAQAPRRPAPRRPGRRATPRASARSPPTTSSRSARRASPRSPGRGSPRSSSPPPRWCSGCSATHRDARWSMPASASPSPPTATRAARPPRTSRSRCRLACLQNGLTPAEVLLGVTRRGGEALGDRLAGQAAGGRTGGSAGARRARPRPPRRPRRHQPRPGGGPGRSHRPAERRKRALLKKVPPRASHEARARNRAFPLCLRPPEGRTPM